MITSSLLYNFGTAGPNKMDPATYQIVSTMPVLVTHGRLQPERDDLVLRLPFAAEQRSHVQS